MAKNDNLTDYLIDLADGIRAKKGTTDPINPQDFRKEIESISGGGNGGSTSEGDWEYYEMSTFLPQTDAGLGEMAVYFMLWGVRAELKKLVGYYNSKKWWFTVRGSYLDFETLLDSGQDDYDGPTYIAIDLSQRIKSTRSGALIDLSYREILYADSTHPQWRIIEICRQQMPLITAMLNATKISKEEWERDDYTGVILE